MQRLRTKGIVLAITLLIFIAAFAIAAYAAQAFAEPARSVEYSEYRNDRWHFSLAAPADMTVAAYDQPGQGQTMRFVDVTHEYKFQISAWRYTQLDLTLGREGAARSAGDQPDRLEIVDVVRDDLFTVLFEKNGVRYSVVAMPEDEAWAIDILTT